MLPRVKAHEMHGKIVMELREKLAPPLLNIFKASMETGLVPQNFTGAIVVPLHKKGSRDKAENYRPISLTSIIGKKIFDSIIKDKVVEFLEEKKIVSMVLGVGALV